LSGTTLRLQESNKVPSADDFRTFGLQISAFTQQEGFQSGRALNAILSGWSEVFTSIVFASDLPHDVPGEIPRIVAQSADGRRKVQVSPSRIDLINSTDTGNIDIPSNLHFCIDVIGRYIDTMRAQVTRMAIVVSRLYETDDPAIQLAHHFFQDRWWANQGPLNRPSDLEVHSAKQYRLRDEYNVNSWIRFRTPISIPSAQTRNSRSIFVEQDINIREIPGTPEFFSIESIRDFFSQAWRETEDILGLYLPGEHQS
jgi:hypothetical protein